MKKPSSQARCSDVNGALSGNSAIFGGGGLWVMAPAGPAIQASCQRSRAGNAYESKGLDYSFSLLRACRGRRLPKFCATQKRCLGKRDEQDDDLADLLDRAQHIAGLAVDLRQAQPGQQRRYDRDRNERREAKTEAEA
jgi:hypothetical protein